MANRTAAYVTALAIFVIDQLTKWVVSVPLALQARDTIEILPIFRLRWVENNGISLGLLNATTPTGRWMLVAMTAAIAIGVAWWIRREEKRGDPEPARVGDLTEIGSVPGHDPGCFPRSARRARAVMRRWRHGTVPWMRGRCPISCPDPARWLSTRCSAPA